MQPKKAPIMKHITKKMSKEDVTTSSVLESNSGGEGQKALAKEPEIIVYLPSCKKSIILYLATIILYSRDKFIGS